MWQQLPEDLAGVVWRTYFTTHVLPLVHISDRMLACRSISCTYRMDPVLRQFLTSRQHAASRENASRCICKCAREVVAFLYYEDNIYEPLDRGCTATELCELKSKDSDLEEMLWEIEVHYDPDPEIPDLWRQQHAEVHHDDVDEDYGNRAEQDAKIKGLQHCGCAEGCMCLWMVEYLDVIALCKQEDASPE